jgi:hypothetical protein
MIATSPNFALLDVSRPDVARLVAAMVTAQKALVPLSETGCRSRRRRQMQQQSAPAALDRFAPVQRGLWPAARQRTRPDAGICGGEVSC